MKIARIGRFKLTPQPAIESINVPNIVTSHICTACDLLAPQSIIRLIITMPSLGLYVTANRFLRNENKKKVGENILNFPKWWRSYFIFYRIGIPHKINTFEIR